MRKEKPTDKEQVANELAPALRKQDRMEALAPTTPKKGTKPGKPA